MAINPRDETVYDNKIDESDLTNYPYGKARNITTPGDGTGTPWDQIFINELWGYFQATLVEANITPNGNPETVQASQYLEAIQALMQPRGRTYVDETSNRALGTTYTNTADHEIYVQARVSGTSSSTVASLAVDNAVVSTFSVQGSSNTVTVSAAIPAGQTYRVTTNASHSIASWRELK